MLSTSNYFERTRSIDFSKLPKPLRDSHDLVKKVGTGQEPWQFYNQSPNIRNMIDLYFQKLDAYLEQQKPKKKDSLTERYKDHPSDKARAAKEREKQAPKPAKAVPVTPASAPKSKAAAKAQKPADSGPKRTKVKKHGNQNLRVPVSHLATDVAVCRRVLSLSVQSSKLITRTQIKALHAAIEKAIVERRVRKTDPHAKLFSDMAGFVAALLKKMTDGGIDTVDYVRFSDQALLRRVRAVAESVEVRSSVNLLRQFINMQGTTPEQPTVKKLITALEKHRQEQPGDANHAATGAAVAVLRDWKSGRPLKITTQQLQGLRGVSGLGCPDTPAGADCGCAKKAGH